MNRAAQSSVERRRHADIGSALRCFVDDGDVPGFAAAAVTDNGPLCAEAFGLRDVARGLPMRLDTVFWIASLTKPVTSVAAMQMVEEGRLRLDQPAGEIVPELRSLQVLEGFDAAGAPRLRPARGEVTLRRLLTHTAGVTYDTWNENTARYVAYAGLPSLFTCTDVSLRTPLAFDPGTAWQYGAATDWVGKMVEWVSGQRLEEYFRDHIFAPLGMADTSFRLNASQRERLATMYQRQDDGSLQPIDFEVPQEPEFYMGGGGLYSTASDYLKFAALFLDPANAPPVLQPETVRAMARNQIGDLSVVRLTSYNRGGANDAEFFPGMVKKWGFGFMINTEQVPTGRSAGSLAWAGAANEYFWIDPAKRVAGVMLMQFFPFCDRSALDAFAGFEAAVYRTIGAA